jgi:Zn-dependent peptidase ImmA (M78 family)
VGRRGGTDDVAARSAAAVIARLGLTEPPVSLEKICRGAGLTIVARPFDYIAGVLIRDDVFPVILVNARDRLTRRRFTIAHELGHFFMGHKKSAFAEPAAKGRAEREAERFAAHLLMPEAWVRRLWAAYADNAPNRPALLAERFDVSRAAFENRARELGLDPAERRAR